MRFFRECCSVSNDFTKLCLAFNSDYPKLALAYDIVDRSLNENSTSHVGVSESARDERELVEFCLSRLCELRSAGTTGLPAVLLLLDDIEDVEWDRTPFLLTIPSKKRAARMYETTFLDKCRQGRQWITYGWDNAKSLLSLIPPPKRLYSDFWVFRWTANVLMIMIGIWVGAWLVLKVLKWMMLDIAGGVMSLLTTLIRSAISPLSFEPAVRWISTIFSPINTPRKVDSASQPISPGVSEAARQAILMSTIAANLSLIPHLLQHARLQILPAAHIISGSDLQFKDQLAAEYTKLVGNMDETIVASHNYTLGVDSLISRFESLLSDALSRVSIINAPIDMENSLSALASIGCGYWWLQDPHGLHHTNPGTCALCTGTVLSTVTTALCLRASPLLPRVFCKQWISYIPGVESSMEKVVERRLDAVQNLRQFLEALDLDFQDLIIRANHGLYLCQKTEQNFGKIAQLNTQNENAIMLQLDVIEKNKWRWQSWMEWVGISHGIQYTVSGLQVNRYNLNQSKVLQGRAFYLFSSASNVLLGWKSQTENLHSNLRIYESLASRSKRDAWKDQRKWDELRKDFEKLKPILTQLTNAYHSMIVKSEQGEEAFRKARNACFEKARASISWGLVFDWEDCYNVERLLLMT